MNKNGKNGNGHTKVSSEIEPFAGLDDVDVRLIELKMERPAATQKEIFEAAGIAKSTAFYRVNKPEFQKCLADIRREAFEMIQNGKVKAAKKILDLLDSSDEDIVFKAAQAILADYLPARQVNISGAVAHVHFNAQVAEEELIDKIERISGGNMKEQRN